MKTTVIGIRDFRKMLTQHVKNKNQNFLVTVHNKPVFEVKNCVNQSPELDEAQIQYYKTIEKGLDFWNEKADNEIFAS